MKHTLCAKKKHRASCVYDPAECRPQYSIHKLKTVYTETWFVYKPSVSPLSYLAFFLILITVLGSKDSDTHNTSLYPNNTRSDVCILYSVGREAQCAPGPCALLLSDIWISPACLVRAFLVCFLQLNSCHCLFVYILTTHLENNFRGQSCTKK